MKDFVVIFLNKAWIEIKAAKYALKAEGYVFSDDKAATTAVFATAAVSAIVEKSTFIKYQPAISA